MTSLKTVATRQRLLDTALDLFEAQGYSATTVDDIAQRAGVTAMTFFRHFRTKEAVVLEDHFDPVIAESVAHQSATLPPVERVARGLRQALEQVDEDDDAEIRRRIAIAASEPTLRSGMHQNTQATEDAIVDVLVRDGSPEFPARIAASACLNGITASLLWWASSSTPQTLRDAVLAALDVVAPDPTSGAPTAGGAS